MLLHYVEMGDGTRHVHKGNCGELSFQLSAEEVWEVELDDEANDDEILIGIWEEFLNHESDEEEFDTYAELTVYRRCVAPLLPLSDDDDETTFNPKADAFMDEATAAGWDVEWEWVDKDVNSVSVTAKREYVAGALRTHEELHLGWYRNKLESAFYVDGHEDSLAKKISSVAGTRPYLLGTPSQPIPKEAKSSRQVKREEPVKRELKEMIPFDMESAYDHEILDACRGKKLVWWNTTAEDYESATVIGKNPNHYKIEIGTAGRAIISFVSIEGGYRAVALENLVQVR